MDSFPDPPILLFEDNALHVKQIREVMKREGLEVEHIAVWNENGLYNYKAWHPESQIVITDLRLNSQAEPSATEGLDLIRDHLWPVDRTTIFVVFSQYLPGEQYRRRYPVEPYWTFVEKEVLISEGELQPRCLDTLAGVVRECQRHTIPTLLTPWYDSYFQGAPLSEYVREFPHCKEQMTAVRMSVELGCDRLNLLARAAEFYNRAGRECTELSIGVYGSCGRMEMREDSDLECSVYYSPPAEDTGSRKKLAVAFWNRITRSMENQEWSYEGSSLIRGNASGLLQVDQAADPLGSGYQAVFNTRAILSAPLHKNPQVRNRHLQVLTELRPVFNPDHLTALKRDLLASNLGRVPVRAREVARSTYLRDLLTQFSMDAGPEKLNTWYNAKRAAYRILNILALRLWMVGRVRYQDAIEETSDLVEFLDEMCDAGVIKVCRFTVAFLKEANREDRDLLRKPLEALVDQYAVVHERLATTAPRGGDDPQLTADMRSEVSGAVQQFIHVFEALRHSAAFSALAASNLDWMFATDPIRNVFR